MIWTCWNVIEKSKTFRAQYFLSGISILVHGLRFPVEVTLWTMRDVNKRFLLIFENWVLMQSCYCEKKNCKGNWNLNDPKNVCWIPNVVYFLKCECVYTRENHRCFRVSSDFWLTFHLHLDLCSVRNRSNSFESKKMIFYYYCRF